MLVLDIILIHLLLACAYALDLMCTLQLCLHAFTLRAGNSASALHIQVEHILGEGYRGPNWKWVVDRYHGHVGWVNGSRQPRGS